MTTFRVTKTQIDESGTSAYPVLTTHEAVEVTRHLDDAAARRRDSGYRQIADRHDYTAFIKPEVDIAVSYRVEVDPDG